jgi:hypothetical protein
MSDKFSSVHSGSNPLVPPQTPKASSPLSREALIGKGAKPNVPSAGSKSSVGKVADTLIHKREVGKPEAGINEANETTSFAGQNTATEVDNLNKNYASVSDCITELYEIIDHQGVVSPEDFNQLEKLEHDLHAVKHTLHKLNFSDEVKAAALKQIYQTEKLLRTAHMLADCIQRYDEAVAAFDEAEGLLMKSSYGTYESGAPLLAMDHIQKSMDALKTLSDIVDSAKGNPAVHARMMGIFESDAKHLAFVMDDWSDALGKTIAHEYKELSRWMDATQDPTEKKSIKLQLATLEEHLEKVHTFIETKIAKNLSVILKQHPEVQDSVDAMKQTFVDAKTSADAKNLAKKPYVSDLHNQLKDVALPQRGTGGVRAVKGLSLAYGSDGWKELIKKRPQAQPGFVERAKNAIGAPETWNDTTKRWVGNFFSGMQLVAGAIGFSNMLPRNQALAEQAKPPVPSESIKASVPLVPALAPLVAVEPLAPPKPSDAPAVPIPLVVSHGFSQEQLEESQNDVKGALAKTQAIEHQLVDHPELKELRAATALLQRELLNTASKEPSDTCPREEFEFWKKEVDAKCYAIKSLEQNVSLKMELSREALAVDDAELDKFGKKHLNLVKMARVAEALEVPGITVPLPHGVQSENVRAFLEKSAPEVFEHWQALSDLFKSYKGTQRFLETPEAKQHLEDIDVAIARAFSLDNAYDSLNLAPELVEWVSSVNTAGNYLMVRSTGSEDSKEMANAGGNISKAYVPAEPGPLCAALGDVVRSYFAYGSLQNQINAGQSPFDKELKLAVTTQELIGEPVGGTNDPTQIPISLVLFSDEPLYTGGEKFRVMRLSATYGHGEAVVANQGIATDTALVLVSEAHPDQLYVLYDNKDKPYRLAPVADGEGIVHLEKMRNPDDLRSKPALSKELIARLFHWGVVGQMYFDNEATDMEIVCKGGEIYPVQGRPVVRSAMLPTYVDMRRVAAEALSPIVESLQTDVLVSGKASVVEISNPNQVLSSSTLEEAEKKYDKSLHKLVVVHQDEPANSHPVVNFSGLQMPCLVAKPGAVEKLLAKVDKEHPAAVCTQAGTVNLWDGSKGDIADFTSEGYAVHPAKIAVSIPASQKAQPGGPQQIPQEVKDLLTAIRSAATKEVAVEKIQQLQAHPFVQEVSRRREDLEEQINNQPITAPEITRAFKVVQLFESQLLETLEEAKAVISHQAEDERLKPLLHAKAIESVLVGRLDSAGSVGQYSVPSIMATMENTQALIDYQKQLPFRAHFADVLLVGNNAMSKEGGQQWKDFLLKLEPLAQSGQVTRAQIQSFKDTLKVLKKADALAYWMTFSAPGILGEKNANPTKQIDALIATLPQKDIAFFQQQIAMKESLEELHDQIDLFAHKGTFEKGWKALQDYVSPEKQKALSEQMKDASPMAKVIALKTMAELVEVYDIAIKTMKTSPEWTDLEKVKLFKEMLEPSLELLKSWHAGVVRPGAIPEAKGKNAEGKEWSWPIGKYIGKVEELFKNMPDQVDQLRPSSGFSVSAAVFGSGSDFERHYPQHLEDVFTLLHQNLLVCVGSINNDLNSSDDIAHASLPRNMKAAISTISSVSIDQIDVSGVKVGIVYPNRIGLDVNEDSITVDYNVPLRSHSAHLKLAFNKDTGTISLKGQFLGMTGGGRWGFLGSIVNLMNNASILPLSNPLNQGSLELTFSWVVTDQKTLQMALEEFSKMADYTFADTAGREDAFVANLIDRCIQNNTQELLFNTAITSFAESSPAIQNLSLRILKIFIEKGHPVGQSEKAALEGALSEDLAVSNLSTNLLLALIEKGQDQDYASIEKVALRNIQNKDPNIRDAGWKILTALAERGHSQYDRAGIDQKFKELALEEFKHIETDWEASKKKEDGGDMSYFAAMLVEKWERNGSQDLLFNFSMEILEKPGADKPELLLRIVQVLILKGHPAGQSEKMALEGLRSQDDRTKVQCIRLLEAIIEKGQVQDYDAIEKAVSSYLASGDALSDEFEELLTALRASKKA